MRLCDSIRDEGPRGIERLERGGGGGLRGPGQRDKFRCVGFVLLRGPAIKRAFAGAEDVRSSGAGVHFPSEGCRVEVWGCLQFSVSDSGGLFVTRVLLNNSASPAGGGGGAKQPDGMSHRGGGG